MQLNMTGINHFLISGKGANYEGAIFTDMKDVPVELEKNFTTMRHIEKKAKEKVRNAHKLQNDFLSRIKVLTTNEKSEYLNSILCLLNEVIEHAEDKVKLAVQTYDEVC